MDILFASILVLRTPHDFPRAALGINQQDHDENLKAIAAARAARAAEEAYAAKLRADIEAERRSKAAAASGKNPALAPAATAAAPAKVVDPASVPAESVIQIRLPDGTTIRHTLPSVSLLQVRMCCVLVPVWC